MEDRNRNLRVNYTSLLEILSKYSGPQKKIRSLRLSDALNEVRSKQNYKRECGCVCVCVCVFKAGVETSVTLRVCYDPVIIMHTVIYIMNIEQ